MPVTDVKKDLDALTMSITAEFEAGAERAAAPPISAHRLRFEDGFADDEGKPNEELPTTVATVTISEADGTTTMSIESRFAGREQMEQVVEMGMEQGITEAVGQIDAILGEGS